MSQCCGLREDAGKKKKTNKPKTFWVWTSTLQEGGCSKNFYTHIYTCIYVNIYLYTPSIYILQAYLYSC